MPQKASNFGKVAKYAAIGTTAVVVLGLLFIIAIGSMMDELTGPSQ
ncbi:MAG: hypothetical protein OXH63_21880 [Gemmatimonadetes bacterium]|nr:hypothetical protein [Gemmatimonadota bacterium]